MARPAIAVALPSSEAAPVSAELRAAGFTVATVNHPDELEAQSHVVGQAIAVLVADLDRFKSVVMSLSRSSTARPISTSRSSTTRCCERTVGRSPH